MLALVSVVGEMAAFSMVVLHEEVFLLPQPCLEEQRGEEQGEKRPSSGLPRSLLVLRPRACTCSAGSSGALKDFHRAGQGMVARGDTRL